MAVNSSQPVAVGVRAMLQVKGLPGGGSGSGCTEGLAIITGVLHYSGCQHVSHITYRMYIYRIMTKG